MGIPMSMNNFSFSCVILAYCLMSLPSQGGTCCLARGQERRVLQEGHREGAGGQGIVKANLEVPSETLKIYQNSPGRGPIPENQR